MIAIASIGLAAASAGLSQGKGAWNWALPTDMVAPSVPADNPMTSAKVALGRRLFHDADLSINGTLSCATCHEQRHSFSDGVQAHPGAHGEPGLRNVPSLLNVAWQAPFTWANPVLDTLEAQALVPITGDDPIEMGMKGQETEIARRLGRDSCYRKMFRAAFPAEKGRISLDTVAKALATFERTMVSFNTAWDRSRTGGMPLPVLAQQGEELFRGASSCVSCHSGINLTDSRLHVFAHSPRDRGAVRATGQEQDAGKFRTPSLRNVMLTAPYLHDGSAPTIATAIVRHGIILRADEETAILAFLGKLTDESITTDPRFTLPAKSCGSDL